MSKSGRLMVVALLAIAVLVAPGAFADGVKPIANLESKFPRLSSGPLSNAVPAKLPAGVLLMSGGTKITGAEVEKEIALAPPSVKSQLTKYRFVLLELMAIRKFLAIEANAWAAKNTVSGAGDQLVQSYLKSVASKATITDQDAAEFYAGNLDMFKGRTLEQARQDIKGYLLGQEQGRVIRSHVVAISRRHSIRISDTWANRQYAEWTKNPVEQARRSGIPTMVEFGSDGCKPCEMMAPIIDEVRTKFAGKLNVVFVHVGQQPVLGVHYDTSVIPVQTFYDKLGNESYRHEGFLDKPSVLKRIADLGVE